VRELEFLPAWYPTLRQRRRHVVMQAWLSVAAVVALVMWVVLSQRNVRAAEFGLNNLQNQLSQANEKVKQLGELQALKRQMSQQAQVVSQLGPHVPTARLLDALDDMMPKDMAILDLELGTEEQMRSPNQPPGVAGGPGMVTRRLRIRLHGVAPSDVELGYFMDRIAGIPKASDVLMTSKDRVENGHQMCDFEVTFVIDLNEDD
jgi:Tfp pilus assembly protein PilN